MRWLLPVLVLLLGAPTAARAALITWSVEGVVQDFFAVDAGPPPAAEVERLSSLGVTTGAPVVAQLSFESSTPLLISGPPTSPSYSYPGAVLLFEVWVGSFHSASSATIFPRPARFGSPVSLYFIQGRGSGDVVLGDPLLNLSFLDDTPGSLDGTDLLVEPPDLAAIRPYSADDFTTNVGWTTALNLLFPTIFVEIELSEVRRVPEPGGAALLALAAASVAALRLRLSWPAPRRASRTPSGWRRRTRRGARGGSSAPARW